MQKQSASFATTIKYNPLPKEKDYYQILGIESTATLEQIKDAYRAAVKRHHPDVIGSEQPDVSIFRDVQEAYGVLATRESRASYDLARKKNPDDYRPASELDWNRANRVDLRGTDGHIPVDAPKPGSYAE
jgi:DnaJ-class molecular chaperone